MTSILAIIQSWSPGPPTEAEKRCWSCPKVPKCSQDSASGGASGWASGDRPLSGTSLSPARSRPAQLALHSGAHFPAHLPAHFGLERHFGVSWAVQRLPGVLDKSESGGKAKTSRNRVRGLKNRCLGIAKFRNKAPNRSRETLPAVPKSAQMQARIRRPAERPAGRPATDPFRARL